MSRPNAPLPIPAPPPIIAPEGRPIVVAFVIASLVLTAGTWLLSPYAAVGVGLVCLTLTIWCVWFFRDPERSIPLPQSAKASEAGSNGTIVRTPVISPADGVVSMIIKAAPPPELGMPLEIASRMTRVSVFMNVFNVHVNRAPVSGTIVAIRYRAGKFFNAAFDKASEHNERSSMRLRMDDGREIACVQIAGLIARRIVSRVREGGHLDAGERYGLIRFGSRVDVYLPEGVAPLVKLHDRCVAGETILAWMPTLAPADPALAPPLAVSGSSPRAMSAGRA